MDHTEQLARVRRLVGDRFSQLTDGQLEDFCETILVRDGFYCGRRFACRQWRAEWLVGDAVLRILDWQGNSLELIALDPAAARQQAA